LLGNNYIILNPQNNPNNFLIYSLEIKESNIYDYKLKYAFQFINSSINEMKEIINCEYLVYYLFKKNNIDISKYGKQTFPEGMFINYNEEKIGILSYTKPPLIGLANIGATCYMNATLQSLSNIDSLTNYFLLFQNIFSQDDIKYDLSKEYAKLIKNLWDTKNTKKYFEPYDFKNKISQKNPLFSGIAANDSKDLILFIFQELHNELNIINPNNRYNMNNIVMNNQFRDQRNEKEEYKLFIKNYYSCNNSIIQKIFYGEQETINYCHNCKAKIYNFSIYSFLIFPLEKVRLYLASIKKDGFEKVTLEDCFLNYISEEIMSGDNQMYCNYCHRNSNYSMINKIYTHPEVLVIILNRGKGLEFDVEFEYPETFILNNYINFENNNNYQNCEIIEYELINVITHLGESSMSGHFIAYCKSPIDNKWYKYNDAIVSESTSDFINSNNDELKAIPYVLFYKINKQNFMDFLQTNSQNLINENLNNNLKSNIITIYFDITDEKQLYIDIDEDKLLNDAIKLLIKNSKLPSKQYICYKGNRQLDVNKSIKENLLINEDHIKMI
jgi:ubiquitin carboxyl-terminal hydrolase 2/21